MNIGKNIMNYRKRENLSQESLAEKIGVTRQTISNWELEESYPDVKDLIKLAKIFNVRLDDLVTYKNVKEEKSDYKITIISKVENVIVSTDKVVSSDKYAGGKSSPKYALFSVNESSKIFPNNTFLGWYEDKESISKEIEEISYAIKSHEEVYELKYNVSVEKKLFGLSIKKTH